MILSFARVEALFAFRHQISDDSLMAFRGRLQHFQRLKFPYGINTGRGKRAQYGWDQLFQLSYAFDFIEMGQTPEVAIGIINQHRDSLMVSSAASSPVLILIEINALTPLKKNPSQQIAKIWPMPKDAAIEDISNLNQPFDRPVTIIDPRSTASFFLEMIPAITGSSCEYVQEDFEQWSYDTRVELVDKLAADLDQRTIYDLDP